MGSAERRIYKVRVFKAVPGNMKLNHSSGIESKSYAIADNIRSFCSKSRNVNSKKPECSDDITILIEECASEGLETRYYVSLSDDWQCARLTADLFQDGIYQGCLYAERGFSKKRCLKDEWEELLSLLEKTIEEIRNEGFIALENSNSHINYEFSEPIL